MRISNAVHEARPWRIRDIASDFTLEDVWALPAHGGAEDFQALLELMVSLDPANSQSLPARIVWRARDRLGAWFDLGTAAPIDRGRADAGGQLPIPGTTETSLIDRLPADLSNTADGPEFHSTPFASLYRTDDEYAAELSNRTLHAVLHLDMGRSGRRPLPRTNGHICQATGRTRQAICGDDQSVPVPDCLPSTHASDRTSVEYPHFAVKRVRLASRSSVQPRSHEKTGCLANLLVTQQVIWQRTRTEVPQHPRRCGPDTTKAPEPGADDAGVAAAPVLCLPRGVGLVGDLFGPLPHRSTPVSGNDKSVSESVKTYDRSVGDPVSTMSCEHSRRDSAREA